MLTSATIPDTLPRQLGLSDLGVARVASPFNYPEHALLYVPPDLPARTEPGAEEAITAELVTLISAAGGRTLALFTNRGVMARVAAAVAERIRRAVREATGLTCSVGIAPNKLLAKLGSYGLLRFAVGLLPLALSTVRPYMLTLAVIGIIYGSALAATTPDLKRLVAYSSLAQMGFVTLGIMTGSTIATTGAVLLMFNHGVITAGLFLLIGYIERRRGSATIADLRGMQGPAPVLAGLFTVVMMASIGLPGLSGFISEFLVLVGAFSTHVWWAVAATIGVVLAAVYLLWAYQRVFHGQARDIDQVPDVTHRERWVIAPIVAIVVVLGIFPKPVLDRVTPTAHQFVESVTPAGVNK